MRRFLLVLFLTPILAFAQEDNETASASLSEQINEFISIDGSANEGLDVSDFIRKFDQQQVEKNSIKFCRILFNKTSREFFRRYTQEASFGEMLSKGNYNCLTGTALYALLLDHFAIPYTIIETNYHIFLMASTKDGNVLFEATDPLNGFIDNPSDIEKRIQQYKLNSVQRVASDTRKYYAYNFSLYKPVNLSEIKGLLHYNLSIEAYNGKHFEPAINHLEQATALYNSPRTYEFSTVMLLAVMESDIEIALKQTYIKRIQNIRKKQLHAVASRNYTH
jgi:hypothetical protein